MEIRETLEHGAAELKERVRPEVEAVKERLGDINSKVVSFIKAHPTKVLIGALAFGYLVGRIARGGSSRHGGV